MIINYYYFSSILFENVELISPQGKQLVSNFNLEISNTDRVVILGPNGKNKIKIYPFFVLNKIEKFFFLPVIEEEL